MSPLCAATPKSSLPEKSAVPNISSILSKDTLHKSQQIRLSCGSSANLPFRFWHQKPGADSHGEIEAPVNEVRSVPVAANGVQHHWSRPRHSKIEDPLRRRSQTHIQAPQPIRWYL